MPTSMVYECLFVFIGTAIADFLWTQYIIAIGKYSPIKAATWSSSIILVNSAVVVMYVNNHWTIIAAVIGAFVGTYLSVKMAKRNEQ